MPDLRTVLTETQLGDIRFRVALALQSAESDCLESGTIPGYTMWADAAINAMFEALAGLPGVAVTQLPEPSHAGTVSTSFRHVTYWHSVHQVRGEKRLITVDDPGRCMSADEARVLAADLLAAAAALSVEGNTNA